MNTIILDTETTGIEDPRLVQLAYEVLGSEPVSEYFKPPKLIEFSAMAISHITNGMVADKPSFEGSDVKSNLQDLLNDGVLVAHNASFDIKVLEAEGVKCEKYICTMQCAQHLLDYEGGYGMQELRYALNLNVDAVAHDALGDIKVLKALFQFLMSKMDGDYDSNIKKMIELTQKPIVLKMVTFGKHKGMKWSEVPISYLSWLYNSEMQKPFEERNLNIIATTQHYLNNQ